MDAHATTLGEGTPPSYSFALWNLVIRPPRATYHTWQLGPNEFHVSGVKAMRRDFRLQATTGGSLACSHYLPWREWDEPPRRWPVVVYLHGNSSNRLEANGLLGPLLAHGVSLFCFDSAGCGQSDGDYVSLGWHEREDLAAVLEHLRESPCCGPIGLWGRSMGAVTVLLHADRDPGIGAICVDSPFVSLRRLIEDLANSAHVMCPVPNWLVVLVFAVIRMRVKTLANFDMEDIAPLEHAKQSFVPGLFMHGQEDTFISPGHSRQLYDAYMGDKEFVLLEGEDHNSERSPQAIGRAVDFFCRAFRLGDVDLSVTQRDSAGCAPVESARRRSVTPPPQPRQVEPLASPPPPTPTERLERTVPAEPPRAECEKGCLRIEFSPSWQTDMEEMLLEVGWSSEANKKRLSVTDNAGNIVSLFADARGKVPACSRFPLTIRLLPLCGAAKAARGGG